MSLIRSCGRNGRACPAVNLRLPSASGSAVCSSRLFRHGHRPRRQRAPPGVAAAQRPRRARLYVGLGLAAGLMAVLGLLRPWHLLPGGRSTALASNASQDGAQKSVAVLPFTDMSEKHDQEYFSDGLSEELIDVLTKIPDLRVPARTSSFSFRGKAATIGEIARELGVTHVLEGSVRKAGDRMRITAQLVRADNGFHVWSQTYDREVRDVFAVQDDIAHAVAEQLKSALLMPAEATKQTGSVEAHNLYLKARYLATSDTPADLTQAVALYEQALQLDPNYAQAWAWLAYAHIRRIAQGSENNSAEAHQRAMGAARRAIELDPNLPEAYSGIATANLQFERNWSAAAQALDKAAALDPNDTLVAQIRGHLSAAIATPAEAMKHFRKAVDGDPLNMLPRKYLGRALYYDGQPSEAVAELRRAIELNPKFPGLHYELGRALLQLSQADAAVAAFEGEPSDVWRVNGLPLGYFAAHRMKEAQAALAGLLANSGGAEFQVAETYAYFGQPDKAFEWLDRARVQHDPGLIWTRRDPLFASIAADPRFAAFLESVAHAAR